MVAEQTNPRASSSLLKARGFSKTFGLVRVLNEVDITVASGEIRGLVGQNGSGKSTLIKLLTGVYEPDAGAHLVVQDKTIDMYGAGWNNDAGLAVMHQDLGLEPSLSIADNFIIDGTSRALRRIPWRRERTRIKTVLEEYGLSVDVRQPVGDLSRTEQAVVAMARAFDRLKDEVGVIILDEPTAALEQERADALFDAIRAARSRGCGVLFVSHDLQEIVELCDSVTVLRDGFDVASGGIESFTKNELIRAIVGTDIGELYPFRPREQEGEVVLSARDIHGTTVNGLSFDLHQGEILGVTGIGGMGHDEVGALLYGSRPLSEGEVHLFGAPFVPTPHRALSRGLVFLPADRKALGGDPYSTIEDNLILPIAPRYFKRGRIQKAAAREAVRAALVEFDVRPPDPSRLLGELSGGNQQKALLAKWIGLYGNSRILILHEPTQGVDVGARHAIFSIIRKSAASGQAILYISAEYEDLAHLCNRVLVLRGGRAVADIGQDNLTTATIAGLAMASTDAETPSAVQHHESDVD
jgi:ribose transport system ATP-binding protein